MTIKEANETILLYQAGALNIHTCSDLYDAAIVFANNLTEAEKTLERLSTAYHPGHCLKECVLCRAEKAERQIAEAKDAANVAIAGWDRAKVEIESLKKALEKYNVPGGWLSQPVTEWMKTLRALEAKTWREAAKDTYCLASQLPESDGCQGGEDRGPCCCCMQAARLEGKAAALEPTQGESNG